MKTVTYSDAEIQRLIDGGWKETAEKSGMWLRGEMNPRHGGNSTGEALRQQNKLDIIAKYGAYYYTRPDREGFGYFLGCYRDNLENPTRVGIDHITENEANKLVERYNSQFDYEPISGIDYHPQEWLQMVVFKEKHGDRNFIVKTKQDLYKVALKIVIERNDQDWYCFDNKKPVEPKVSVEDAKKLGMDSVITAVEREWSNYKYSKAQYDEGLLLALALKKSIRNKDGELALKFLNSMKDGEYEAFEVISGEDY